MLTKTLTANVSHTDYSVRKGTRFQDGLDSTPHVFDDGDIRITGHDSTTNTDSLLCVIKKNAFDDRFVKSVWTCLRKPVVASKGHRRSHLQSDMHGRILLMGYIEETNGAARASAFTRDPKSNWNDAEKIVQAIRKMHEQVDPSGYHRQRSTVMQSIPSEFVIGDTPYTTANVNLNVVTTIHTDAGNLRDSCTVAMGVFGNDFTGADLVFPRYGARIVLRPGDFIVMNASEWHCNSPLTLQECGNRLVVTCYAREGLGSDRASSMIDL